jgi:hypothetical protein
MHAPCNLQLAQPGKYCLYERCLIAEVQARVSQEKRIQLQPNNICLPDPQIAVAGPKWVYDETLSSMAVVPFPAVA